MSGSGRIVRRAASVRRASPAGLASSPLRGGRSGRAALLRRAVLAAGMLLAARFGSVGGFAADAAPGKHLLRYRFVADQIVAYDVVHNASIRTQKGETVESTRNVTETRKHLKVTAVDAEGIATIEPSIDRVRMEVRFGENAPTVFDSREAAEPPAPFRGVKQTLGRPLARMRFAPTGKLLSTVPLDAEGHPAPVPAGTAAGGESDDPTRNFLVVLPEEAIAVGHAWHEEFTTSVALSRTLRRPVKLLREYRLTGVEGDRATIATKMSVLTPDLEPEAQAQLIQRTPHGTIVFDVAKGAIVSRHLTDEQTVIGVLGEKSKMEASSTLSEKLADPKVADAGGKS